MRKINIERDYYDSISIEQINDKLLFLKNAVPDDTDSVEDVAKSTQMKLANKDQLEAKYHHDITTPSESNKTSGKAAPVINSSTHNDTKRVSLTQTK